MKHVNTTLFRTVFFAAMSFVALSPTVCRMARAAEEDERSPSGPSTTLDAEREFRTPSDHPKPGAVGERMKGRPDTTLIAGPPSDSATELQKQQADQFQQRIQELNKAQEKLALDYQAAMKDLRDSLPPTVQLDIKRQEAKRKLDAAQAEMAAIGVAQDQPMYTLPDNAAISAFSLKYVRPEDIGQALHNITGGGGPRVAIDERTNTLLIAGSPKQMDVAEKLVQTLDQPGKTERNEMPESVQLRIVWLSEGLSDRNMEPPKPSIVSPQVADALRELGMELPQVVCQQLISLTLNRPDHRAPFHFRVPTDIEDSTWEFQGDGAIVPTANDRYALDFKLALTHADPKGPQSSELSGSILTPLGHYTVMGTTTFVAAAHGSDTGKAQRLSAFVVYVDRPKDFSDGESTNASPKNSGDKSK
jgi:Bacterial type II/III secretion system short domain